VAVLRLSARAHEEHDEEVRAFESCFVAMIFFDQGEREVKAGGDTRRCVDRAVNFEIQNGNIAGRAGGILSP
jgi:hypothetical protein